MIREHALTMRALREGERLELAPLAEATGLSEADAVAAAFALILAGLVAEVGSNPVAWAITPTGRRWANTSIGRATLDMPANL